jgi:hypothetical protein
MSGCRLKGRMSVLLIAIATLPALPANAIDDQTDTRPDDVPTPAQRQAAAVVPVLDEPGILTPRGHWTLEPSLQFSNSSSTRVVVQGNTFYDAFLVGQIDVRSVNRDTLVAALATRYGLTPRLEFELKVPYVYRSDSTVMRPLETGGSGASADALFDADGSGLGDVELALRYQIKNGAGQPFVIGALRVKTRTGEDPFEVDIDPVTGLERELPTGSGFYGVQPSLTFIQVSDPAVFSANVSYLWNIERDLGWPAPEIDPGDIFGFTLGMGLALNEKASFSLGYDHNIVGKTKLSGEPLPTSSTTHLGSLLFGVAYRLSTSKTLNLSVATGVTEAAPDVQITVRVPTQL